MAYYENRNLLDIEGEVWEDVKNYEGYYKVSNLGRVKSIGRTTIHNHLVKEIILKQRFEIDKYLCVGLYKDGVLKIIKVHRLVCKAFIPNPENKPEINHKKGIKIDNRVTELEWNTHKENNDHAWRMGLKSMSNEQKIKASIALKGGLSYKAKGVLNQETGIFYETIGEAAYSANMKRQTLNAMLVGKNRNWTSFIYI